MNRVELYEKIRQELKSLAEKQNIPDFERRYYRPAHVEEENKINTYFYRFCENIVDRQYMANIIKFYTKKTGGKAVLTEVLDNFSVEKTLEYSDSKKLFKEVRRILTERDKTIEEKWNENPFRQQRWEEYCSNIYFIAQFISGCVNDNSKSIDYFLESPKDIDSLKSMLFYMRKLKDDNKQSMNGIGTAMMCNCLKECGAVHFAKPDMHLKRVVACMLQKSMGIDYSSHDVTKDYDKIINAYLKKHKELRKIPYSNCLLNADEYAVVYIYEWAKEVSVTPYQLDRMIYLYCTNGYFYLEDNHNNNISEENLLDCINKNYIS